MEPLPQKYADIAIDVPLRTLFTYRVPPALYETLKRGSRVLVPFHRGKSVGLCFRVKDVYDAASSKVAEKDLKEIIAADAGGLLEENYLKWIEFAADYYVSSPGQVLAQALPPAYLNPDDFAVAKTRRSRPVEIRQWTGSSDITLTAAQRDIAEQVSAHANGFYPTLIRGVTGSGKTEVYIEIIKRVLAAGRSALYLVPEIGLTPQTLSRLDSHFAGQLLVFHSGLTVNQKLLAWQRALGDEPLVMVGTRSAVFAPFRKLGVIVIDEEHDSSYKQDVRLCYNARDLAVMRASLEKIPVVLGSATPSLESFYQAEQGKYRYFELKERVGGLSLPKIELIDISREKEQTGLPLTLSQNVIRSVEAYLGRSEQVILFVGQRGFAQNAFCVSCRAIQTCPNCSVGLKYHSYLKRLKCHYCDLDKPFDEVCAVCHVKALTLLGFGIQAVEEEVKTLFPKARVVRVDSDSYPSPEKLHAVLEDFARRKIDIIVGTQMMSKGHDFENVGFVGVLAVDAHLGLPDFRAAERSFQTLVQVAGRAGRKAKQGHVMVQSYHPDHPSLRCGINHDYPAFARLELAERETLGYPPFFRLVQIRFLSNLESEIKDFVRNSEAELNKMKKHLLRSGIRILGPTEMPLAKLRGKHRYHMLVKIPRRIKNRDVVQYLLDGIEARLSRKIQCQIDVDPAALI